MDNSATKKEIGKVGRYVSVTAVSYIVLIAGTIFMTEILKVNESISYAVTLTLVYVGVYFASSRYVFEVANNQKNFLKFLAVVSIIWTLHNTVFNAFVLWLEINYILAIILNLLVLGPIRYLIYKNWVFKTPTETNQ